MSVWRRLTAGMRVLVRRDAADRDLADEVQHFVDEAAHAFAASGMTPDQARRAAQADTGNLAAIRDQVRASAWEHAVATFAADVRYGIRRLRREAAFTIVAVATLSLGIGAATAIFSVVKPVLLNALPYPNAAKIVAVADQSSDYSPVDATFGSFREILARSRSFDALAVTKPWQPTIVGAGRPERLEGERVSAAYLRVLGVPPLVGRGFDETDDRAAGPNVVVLSDGLWRRRFGADPGVIGRETTLDGAAFTIVGVMPRGFEDVAAPAAELWAPLQYDVSLPIDGREWGHHLKMIGRLGADVPLDRARAELQSIAANRVAAFPRVPWATLGNGLYVTSLQDRVTRDVRPALVAVLGGVLILLTIACVNVTNLQLARTAERRAEFAMRAALGAGFGRLVQQAMTETLVLAVVAGAFGTIVARAGLGALLTIAPAALPRVETIAVDRSSLGFAFAAALVVALTTGVVPAWHGGRDTGAAGVQSNTSRTGRRHRAVRRGLVVAEIALALVLLVGAGLLLHSLRRLFAVDPGFDAADVVVMQVQTAGDRYAGRDATRRFFADALESTRRVAGVQAAGFTSQLPLTGSADMYGVRVQATPTGQVEADGGAFRYAVTPGYLEAMGIAVRRGRLFDAHDAGAAPYVALISESLARTRFRDGGDPIGQWLRIGSNSAPWRRIVGVVADVRQLSLGLDQTDAVYVPDLQWADYNDRAMWLVARTRGAAGALTAAVENAVWTVDKDQPIVRVSTMRALVARSADERRFVLSLIEIFAAVALILAAVGVYGILAGSVTERFREIGVRAALGASRRDILALVIGEGLTLTAFGIGTGVCAAAAASRLMTSLLFDVSPADPITYAGVVGLVCVVSGLAWWVPVSRAVRIDPASALRLE